MYKGLLKNINKKTRNEETEKETLNCSPVKFHFCDIVAYRNILYIYVGDTIITCIKIWINFIRILISY